MRLTLLVGEVQGADYERAFARIAAERAHALLVPASGPLNRDRKRIIELAARHRLPAMYQWREAVDEGGLIAYGSSITELAGRTAAFVDRIFRGANPADLPVERPTTYELAVNQATARALRLAIPPSMLIRAAHVVDR
jgi:putative ABC transport system substrate-binding protein